MQPGTHSAILRSMPVLKNSKHEAFAKRVAAGEAASVSYAKAYGHSLPPSDADRAGAAKLVAKANVADRIRELKEAAANKAEWTIADQLEEFRAIVTADVNELIGTRIGACRFCHGDGHQYHWKEREYLQAVQDAEARGEPLPDVGGGFGYRRTAEPHPDCPECEGEGVARIVPQDTRNLSPAAKLLYQGVKKTRDGFELKIADKDKARDSAARMIGAFIERKEISGPNGAPIQHEVPSLEQLIDEARRLGISPEAFGVSGGAAPPTGSKP